MGEIVGLHPCPAQGMLLHPGPEGRKKLAASGLLIAPTSHEGDLGKKGEAFYFPAFEARFSSVLDNFPFALSPQTTQPGLLSGVSLFPPRGLMQAALPHPRAPPPRNVHLNMILVLQRTCHPPAPKRGSARRPGQKLGCCPWSVSSAHLVYPISHQPCQLCLLK